MQTRGGRETIDRNSFEPAYIQIVRIVTEQIADGRLRPGDQLPSEGQFKKQFGVSSMTIRRSINILVERGLINTSQGRGTFVRPLDIGGAVFKLQELKNQWTEEGETAVRLLEARIIRATAEVAGKLALSPGEQAIHIRRLVLQAGVPAMYHREYVIYDPRRSLVEAQLQITSFEGLLRGSGGEGLRGGQIAIDAISLSEEESSVLQQTEGSPAFRLEHAFYDFSDRPVSWGWFVFRSGSYRLTTQIGADANLT